MDKEIAKLYKDAPRFDEGDIFGSPAYRAVMSRQEHITELLVGTFGEGVRALLDDYTGALYEEMELEAQHFFQEGYRMAKKDQ